ncbi:hypothetical protein GCM10010423_64920 [Streptomyces levis]|uniref:Uncharacterized protein n=1 Tax=Streptomyces levis TaxID=285566 RepID=A0ABN3P3M1_9ACTN
MKKQQCENVLPHSLHTGVAYEDDEQFFIHCTGVLPGYCGNAEPHAGHNYIQDDKHYRCRGVAGDDNVSVLECVNRGTHSPHLWQLTEGASFLRCPGVSNSMPMKQCAHPEIHLGHRWSEDKGLNYVLCGGRKFDLTFCGKTSAHDTHMWVSANGSTAECPGVQDIKTTELSDSPKKWSYHVEKHEDGVHYLVVKKRGDGFDPNWEKQVGKYTSPYYARLVADVLNGGVLMGFEVEQ